MAMYFDNRISILVILLSLVLLGSCVTILDSSATGPGKIFIIHAIKKFKDHKDHPTQIPTITGEFRDELQDFLTSLKQ